MSRELLILRHGKARNPAGVVDFHRPIDDVGRRDAQRVGIWLVEKGLKPDHVVSSPAERAIETAREIVKAVGGSVRAIVEDRRIYGATSSVLLDILEAVPGEARKVLLVGHNPTLKDLARVLSNNDRSPTGGAKLLPTAGLAHLEMPDDWSGLGLGCARLLSVTVPKDLADGFPFPGPEGEERRPHPAYYYTQSSVIPYRVRGGGPEILIIQSNKLKHWVVPKGVKEPDLTLQDSAAQEALEEAGIRGRVDEAEIGRYIYRKWRGDCTCHVFSMEVSEVLPEGSWPESHRGRLWVTPEKAAEKLKQPELGPMVAELARRLRHD